MTKTLNKLLKLTSAKIGQKVPFDRRFQALLGFSQINIPFPIIKIAGTNGKGSVSAMLTAGLTHSGLKVGTFTSPHLLHVKERFRINNEEVAEQKLEEIAVEVEKIITRFIEAKGTSFTPSFFEVLLLIAIILFKKEKIEIGIFEAGIGGKSDALSLLPDILGIITTIGKDHIEKLGPTLSDIAKDKAGISKTLSTLIVNNQIDSSLKEVIRKHTLANRVSYTESFSYINAFKTNLKGSEAIINWNNQSLDIEIPLIGLFQAQNLNLVLSVGQFLIERGYLSFHQKNFIEGLQQTHWPARMETLSKQPQWLIDAAHNEPAFLALKQSLDLISKREHNILLFGCSIEKDYEKMLVIAAQLSNLIYLVDDFYKSRSRLELKEVLQKIDPSISIKTTTLGTAIKEIPSKYQNNLIVVTGSIFMVGIARKIILEYVA